VISVAISRSLVAGRVPGVRNGYFLDVGSADSFVNSNFELSSGAVGRASASIRFRPT
jgi:hypothetical protein